MEYKMTLCLDAFDNELPCLYTSSTLTIHFYILWGCMLDASSQDQSYERKKPFLLRLGLALYVPYVRSSFHSAVVRIHCQSDRIIRSVLISRPPVRHACQKIIFTY